MKKIIAITLLLAGGRLSAQAISTPPVVHSAGEPSRTVYDTTKVKLMLSNRNNVMMTVTGYQVRQVSGPSAAAPRYLDYRMHPIPESFTVWMIKDAEGKPGETISARLR